MLRNLGSSDDVGYHPGPPGNEAADDFDIAVPTVPRQQALHLVHRDNDGCVASKRHEPWVTIRSDLTSSREAGDAAPVTCAGEQSSTGWNPDDWVSLNPP